MDQINNQPAKNCELCDVSQDAFTKLNANNQSQSNNPKKSFWKLGLLFLALVIILTLAGYKILISNYSKAINSESAEAKVKFPDKEKPLMSYLAPDFTLKDIFGQPITLSEFRGEKPVLLVFWATWCGYCAKELPDLKIFSQKYQDKIKVLAVVSGEALRTVQEYHQAKDINFTLLLDEQRTIWQEYLVRGTPAHFLIDKDGRIVTTMPGLASLRELEVMLTMAGK